MHASHKQQISSHDGGTTTASGLHTGQLSGTRCGDSIGLRRVHPGQLSGTSYSDSVRLHTGQLSEARYSGGLRTGQLLGVCVRTRAGGWGGGGAPPRVPARRGARGCAGAHGGMRGRAGACGGARGRSGARGGTLGSGGAHAAASQRGVGGAQRRAGECQRGPQIPHWYITAGGVKYTGGERAPRALMGSGGALGTKDASSPPPPRSMGVGGR